MAVTFGMLALPPDAVSYASGAAFMSGYDAAVEVLGPQFTTLWVSDHLQDGDAPLLECWTRLTYLAAKYPELRVGTLVVGQRYRNPALLAKMATTLQFLTDGRLVLGLGAGWHEAEHSAYGYGGLPSPAHRVEQLTEAVTILRLMWQGGPVTFHGKHYSVNGAVCQPAPSAPIPLLIGSDGNRVLRLAAEQADAWNWDASPDLFYRPYRTLMEHLQSIGRADADITLTAGANVHFPTDDAEFIASWPSGYPGYVEMNHGPTPADAVQSLRPFVEAGVTHFMIAAQDIHTLRVFSDIVAPALADLE
jgi:alkanesulfonate monooxygenase SsuD/methylene tetrahydromethanopterin reductase-like flavin-dependent oxidoreductase (luciferase family)